MKCLVIGATGQLGANLVRVLLEHGHDVRAFHRPTSRTFTIDGLPVERFVGDLNDGESLRRACEKVQVVFHVAGYYPTATVPVDEAKGQALKETMMLLEAVRAANNERLVYASALTTIGLPRQAGRLANESCPFSTRYSANPYLMAKAAMEEKMLQAAAQGIPAVVVVPSQFFGPFDARPSSGSLIVMIAKRRMPGYIQGPVNVIDVRDVAVAMMRAAERGTVGERYVVGHWNTTQKELNQLIADIVGVPPPRLPVPFAVARWGSKVGEFAARLAGKPPMVPAFFVEVIAHMQQYDCSKAIRVLGDPQRAVPKAIEDAVQWFRNHGYLSRPAEGPAEGGGSG
jgi:dihydroflavonol-4-reductase